MFVKNIPFSADQDSLGALFENVKSVRLPTDRDTGRMKGFGYIEFDSTASLDAAIAAGPYNMDGRDLTVDKAGNRPSGNYNVILMNSLKLYGVIYLFSRRWWWKKELW